MALFDFRCQDCRKEYQVRVSYTRKDEVRCPFCGSSHKVQLFKANIKGPISSSGSFSSACGTSGFS